jgi:hypothetical protein
VACLFCRRRCRVRQQSLGRAVVCTHCAKQFRADVPEPDVPSREPFSYGYDGPKGWHVVGGLVLLLAPAALVVWAVARID